MVSESESEKPKISVIMLAENSEKLIGRALDSLVDFNEVVVVDGGSTDQTESIVKSYANTRFVINPWPGFNAQRNFSLTLPKNEWCFMIDSDEACGPGLVEKLHQVAAQKETKKLYRILRKEFFLGKIVENCYGTDILQERLFRKSHISYGGDVHHTHLIDGVYAGPEHPEVENLDPKFYILHNPYYGMEDVLNKIPTYSIEVAQGKIAKGRTTNAFIILLSFIGTFFQIYKRSWRAGRIGFMFSVIEALHRSMVKLYIYQDQHFKDWREQVPRKG